jgi:phytoene desaturase
VAKHVKDARLRVVLSFHPLLVGGNPFSASAIYSLIAFLERRWGVHFVMGGTGRLVQGLVALIEGQGNTLRCNAEVAEIRVELGEATGVRLASGEILPADIVVSNADAAFTYRRLIAPQHRRRWTDRRIERSRHSMSLFVWYFGTRRRYEDVAHHTILLGPRYRELLVDIFRNHRLAADFSLYLHRPTATDTSLAPPGCDAFYVLSPVPHLASGTDWQTAAEPYRQAIARELARTMLPGLEDEIVTSLMMTPQDFQDRLLSHQGAAFGMEPRLTQSAWFRPHNKSEDIANLFLVGAGTHPGAGLPGVLCSAKVLDRLVPEAVLHG